MKQTAVKGAIALALAACGACLRTLLVPVAVLAAVMLSDYVTGMLRAWSARELSSRVGLRGLVKKLGYLFAVGVAVVVDLVLQTAGATLGADLAGVYVFALLVTLWLIGNECISILENVSALGVPVPGFLRAVIVRLKQRAEAAGEAAGGGARCAEDSVPCPTRADAGEALSVCCADSSPRGGAESAERAASSAVPLPPPPGEVAARRADGEGSAPADREEDA